jgi:hypothetical protein
MVQSHLRPAYLLDFELLYRYMFETDTHPVWSNALAYLLRCDETSYLIGPGTRLEIDRFLERLHKPRGHARDRLPGPPELALTRLERILALPNVVSEIIPGLDDTTYRLVKQSLDVSRRRSSQVPNQADALNWAYVVYLRRDDVEANLHYFPYLLTGTRLLLDEQALDPESGIPISRTPQAAIYSEILRQAHPEPVDAMRHTVEMAWDSSQIERDLRLTPAYTDPARFRHEADWEQVVREQRISAGLRTQLETLAKYVADPVMYEAQRVFDNAYVAATNHAQLDGSYAARVRETPRRLFDLITAIAGDDSDGGGLASLWHTVLVLEVTRAPEFTMIELFDRTGRSVPAPYLAVEVHPPAIGRTLPLFVMRWPSSRDAAGLVTAFTNVLAENHVEDISLTLGTSTHVFEFDVALPITFDEMREALADAAGPDSDEAGVVSRRELDWFRADSPGFDLYADVQAPVPQDALVGVFGERLTELSITTLYADTSSRYIFSAWLREALLEIGRQVAHDHIVGTGFRQTRWPETSAPIVDPPERTPDAD